MITSRLLCAFLVVAFFFPRAAQAQIDQTAVLSVTMTDVVAFVLADVAPAIIYDDSDDFENGVTYSHPTGIAGTVTATGNYSISVASADENLGNIAFSSVIPVSSVSVTASGDNLGSTPTVALSTTPQDIISGAQSGVAQTFNLTYATAGGDTNFQGLETGVYSTTLTYSATLD